MLIKFKTIIFFSLFAIFAQSFTISNNIFPVSHEVVYSPFNKTGNNSDITTSTSKDNSLNDNSTSSKIKKNKLAHKKGGVRRKKIPFFVKLGIIFLGVGVLLLLASFWGWIFTYPTGLASWVNTAVAAGAGSVGVGLVFLIISWLSN